MKTAILFICAALLLSACGLGGCAGIPGTGGQDALVKLLMDPNCGHDDTVQFNAGILSGSATRHCPSPAAAPLAVGTVVAPAAAPIQ